MVASGGGLGPAEDGLEELSASGVELLRGLIFGRLGSGVFEGGKGETRFEVGAGVGQ